MEKLQLVHRQTALNTKSQGNLLNSSEKEIGAAFATGDGDVMMRFLPSFLAVEGLRNGMTPEEAARRSIERIVWTLAQYSRVSYWRLHYFDGVISHHKFSYFIFRVWAIQYASVSQVLQITEGVSGNYVCPK